MLLQTVKSRNLWLWGEKVALSSFTSTSEELKVKKQTLENSKNDVSAKLSQLNHDLIDAPESKKSQIQAEIESLTKKSSQISKELTAVNTELKLNKSERSDTGIQYTRTYTSPFKITALQDVTITWENQVGESYGIKTNFLQSWHNKPVNISFSGLSYIGAFGGETVSKLTEKAKEKESFIDSIKNASGAAVISSALTNITNALQTDTTTTETDGKYNTVMDYDIYKINKLLSLYGEGMYKESNAGSSSSWIHLLIENEPSQDGNKSYATFIGHLKNFQYKETVAKPFIYEFSCQFVGEPTITEKIGEGNINAKQDANTLKLSVVSSGSGYSLGYGF